MAQDRPPARNVVQKIGYFTKDLFDGPVTWFRGKYFEIMEKYIFFQSPKIKKQMLQ